jgi:hypothetical protein
MNSSKTGACDVGGVEKVIPRVQVRTPIILDIA